MTLFWESLVRMNLPMLLMRGMMTKFMLTNTEFENKFCSAILLRFNNENICKTNDVNTEDVREAFKDELNAIVENK